MKKYFKTSLAAGLMVVYVQQASAINLQFDYSLDAMGNNFFNTQAKKDVLNAAGTFFSGVIHDDLTAILSGGFNSFKVNFSNPATGLQTEIDDFSVDADTLVIYAGGRVLGGNILGMGGFGGFDASGTGDFVNNAVTRGETPDSSGVQGPTATDFSTWGGSITFDTDTDWYFDPDVSTSGDVVNNDFFSIALHEIAHLLGFGTSDSWNNLISTSGSEFTGAASSSVFGGAVPLENANHWLDGTMGGLLNGVPQEAAMDPLIMEGTRKVFTDLDLAGLTDVGWEVTAVPVPAAIWLFGSGLMGLVVIARRRS